MYDVPGFFDSHMCNQVSRLNFYEAAAVFNDRPEQNAKRVPVPALSVAGGC